MKVQLYNRSPILALLAMDRMDILREITRAPLGVPVWFEQYNEKDLQELAEEGFITVARRHPRGLWVTSVTPLGRAAGRLL